MFASAKIKIECTPELDEVLSAYTNGMQFCVDEAWKRSIKNNIKLHPFVYTELKKTLPAQLSVSCIKQACGIVKKAKTKPTIKRASVRYNFPRAARIKDNTLLLRCIQHRASVSLNIPNCFKHYFSTWNIKEGLLHADRAGRAYFTFCFEKEGVLSKKRKRSVGIDLGIRHTAVTSKAVFYSSKDSNRVNRKYAYLRAKLQAKGTRASKSLLKRISGREQRYRAWRNHTVSKSIVRDCNTTGVNEIVLEDLKGIRTSVSKKQRRTKVHGWSYAQLKSFIAYKAERVGIAVRLVNPFYTSKLCSKCGRIGLRHRGGFSCERCGIRSMSADLNAARNISSPKLDVRQALVNVPHSTTSTRTLVV
jgi:IS605 OrfB family transposase